MAKKAGEAVRVESPVDRIARARNDIRAALGQLRHEADNRTEYARGEICNALDSLDGAIDELQRQ